MCTQKMLFVLPGTLAGLGLWALVAGRGGETGQPGPRFRSLLVALFLVGVALPGMLTLAAFAWHGAGSAFITNNFLLNSRWTHVAQEQLRRVLGGSWPVALLALLGATVSIYRWLRRRPREHGELLLLCILLGLIAGILVVPVAHRQYYLMAIPLLCLFGAKGLLQLVDRARARARPLALGLATLALLVLPVLDVVDSYTQHNDRQLARLRFVFDETGPTDAVMDGWNGTGVFRPHALHHYFLHDESVAMLTPAQVDAYLDGLERGTIRPRLIALDEHLVALGSRFVRFLEAHYESTDGFFYLRKEDAR